MVYARRINRRVAEREESLDRKMGEGSLCFLLL